MQKWLENNYNYVMAGALMFSCLMSLYTLSLGMKYGNSVQVFLSLAQAFLSGYFAYLFAFKAPPIVRK